MVGHGYLSSRFFWGNLAEPVGEVGGGLGGSLWTRWAEPERLSGGSVLASRLVGQSGLGPLRGRRFLLWGEVCLPVGYLWVGGAGN